MNPLDFASIQPGRIRVATSGSGISGYHRQTPILLRGGRCAIGPRDCIHASIEVLGASIRGIRGDGLPPFPATSTYEEIDLSGFLVLPGLINAHDHLEFSLYPRLANPPHRNYVEWGIDIHNLYPEIIAKHRSVSKELRAWWGGIRNLLCGVTTVSHHNPFRAELAREDFPVRVIAEYGWGHSVALGGDVVGAKVATPKGWPFIIHACEGVDRQAREELWELERMGILDGDTVLVHGLALDRDGAAQMRKRGASLIVCPTSNRFLFGKTPDFSILCEAENIALGSDSPLTAAGDFLDEIKFAIQACNLSAEVVYRMVTEAPARILRLRRSEGSIRASGVADLIAVRDDSTDAVAKLGILAMTDIEFVMVRGQVQLVSTDLLSRLSPEIVQGLEPLSIEGTIRWVRAPVKDLLWRTEQVLGAGQVRLGGRLLSIPLFDSVTDLKSEPWLLKGTDGAFRRSIP